MRAAVYAQLKSELRLAGHLLVSDDGEVVPIPAGNQMLQELATEPVSIWTGEAYETIGPEPDPYRFLTALEKAYSGSALRVGIENEDAVILPVDYFAEAWDPAEHPRHPAGTSAGGEFAPKGGGGGGSRAPSEPRHRFNELGPEAQAWLAEIEQHPEFVKARQIITTGTPTDKLYSENGEYTPARAALHHNIVQGILNPNAVARPGEQPVFVLYAGAGGSGKTTALSSYLPLPQDRFTVINADDVKDQLPEYNGYNAALMHEESTHIAERLAFGAAQHANHNIIFDGTGKTYEKYFEMAQLARRQGYRVELLFASADPKISSRRAAERFLRMVDRGHPKPRYVDPRYLLMNVDSRPFDTYDNFKATGAADRVVKVDNNGQQPRLIEDIAVRREARSSDRSGRLPRMGRSGDDAEGGGGEGAEEEDVEEEEDDDLLQEYDPDQPRDPRGSPTGGQWTDSGAKTFPVYDRVRDRSIDVTAPPSGGNDDDDKPGFRMPKFLADKGFKLKGGAGFEDSRVLVNARGELLELFQDGRWNYGSKPDARGMFEELGRGHGEDELKAFLRTRLQVGLRGRDFKFPLPAAALDKKGKIKPEWRGPLHTHESAADLQEYNPNQKRDPKGSSTGGQWTDDGKAAGGATRLDASDFDDGGTMIIDMMRKKFKGIPVHAEKIDKWNTEVEYVELPRPMIAYHASTRKLKASGISTNSNDLSKKSTNLGGADTANYYAEYKLGDSEEGEGGKPPAAIYIHAVLLPAGTKVYDPWATNKHGISVGEPGQLRIFDKIPTKNVLGVLKVTEDKIPSSRAIKAWASKL